MNGKKEKIPLIFLKLPYWSLSYLIWCVCLSTLSTDYKKYLQSSEFTKVLLG